MLKKMNCPYCGTELENAGLYVKDEDSFMCVECDKDFNGDGEEIEYGL